MGISSATNVADAMARIWVDNVLKSDLQNLLINRSELYDLWIGQTRNQGAGANMSMWIGKLTVYSTDPGW